MHHLEFLGPQIYTLTTEHVMVVLCYVVCCQSVLENKYDHVSAIYHLLVDRCKKHQAAIAAGQSAPPPQPVTNSIFSPTHLPVTAKFDTHRRRSSITTGVGASASFYFLLFISFHLLSIFPVFSSFLHRLKSFRMPQFCISSIRKASSPIIILLCFFSGDL